MIQKLNVKKVKVHVIVLVVALYGAALQAAILLENTTEKIKDILLHDVNAFNIVTSGDSQLCIKAAEAEEL
ncbi:unnamed protein product [Rhizophagus irregularis]|uniref:Uncharacterized protein n=1 Tax=Rhizophagus irregularis TaxID=588596 RepID=A0A916EDW6_9GLOM|nr:unnamed protein product [Rhizophagus irregularis]